jgi:hypothetical protein
MQLSGNSGRCIRKIGPNGEILEERTNDNTPGFPVACDNIDDIARNEFNAPTPRHAGLEEAETFRLMRLQQEMSEEFGSLFDSFED